MRGWLAVGVAALGVEVWTWHRQPDDVLSRICGRHPWRTGLVLSTFFVHIVWHKRPWRSHS